MNKTLTPTQLKHINKMVNDETSNENLTYLNGVIDTLLTLGYSLEGIK